MRSEDCNQDTGTSSGGRTDEAHEHTALLPQNRPDRDEMDLRTTIHRYGRLIYDTILSWCNPALAAALLALVLGLVPFTHGAFFSEHGVFKKNIMQAVQQLGDLIPAALPFVVGSKLFSKPSKDAGYTAIAYLIFCRFVLIPGLSILAVFLAKRNGRTDLWVEDPAFDFALIISGAGPPAITLMSVAEIGGAKPEMLGKVARTLLLSYASTPLISATVVLGLLTVKHLYQDTV